MKQERINISFLFTNRLERSKDDGARREAKNNEDKNLFSGVGFAADMLYLSYFAEGEHKTAHYAIATGFMALGMMLPGMAAGWLQETIGYRHFFLWTIICCAATFLVCAFIKIDPEFGKKKQE